MKNKCVLWLTVIVLYCTLRVESFEMNMTKYFMMPNLYDFDDYDRCLQEFENVSTYCFARADVLPQLESESWLAIADVSKYYKHHFDHRHLYFGICMRWCESAIRKLNQTELNDLYNGILDNNLKVNTYLRLFSSEESNRQRYNQLVNQCINLRLKKGYNLKAKSVVEYCTTNREVVEQDSWNLTFYSILCLLTVLVTLSSLYDFYIKNKQDNKILTTQDHYKSNLSSLADRIFVVFSISRNWYRLNQEPNGKSGRELRFLDCLKFFSLFLVIFAHGVWVLYEAAISNPQDPERMLHTPTGTLLLSGSLITITFFVIGGFLLALNWIAVAKVKTDLTVIEYISLFIKFNVFRYLRLTVPYAVVILLSGVYFENAGGPLWRHIVEREQLSCRKNWWINLLYLNNHINTNERCMLQSWYLAADTHSFVLCLLILMIANKWPQIRRKIIAFSFAVFFVLPGIFVYVKKYGPVMIPSPQTQRDSFIEDKDFNEFYVPFQMIIGSYFSGVITALIYDHISTEQYKLHKNRAFQVLWYMLFPLGILWLFSAHPFLQSYFDEPPQFWGSMYAALQRNCWAVGLGVFIIGMSAKVGWIFREFASLPIFRILGRLTYGAFVIHLFVARIAIATLRQPLYLSPSIMFVFVLFTLVVSYLLSFILAILVELPVSAFLKLLG